MSKFKLTESQYSELKKRVLNESIESLDELMSYNDFASGDKFQILRDALNHGKVVSVAFIKKDGTPRAGVFRKGVNAYQFSNQPKSDAQANIKENNGLMNAIDINVYKKALAESGDPNIAAKKSWRYVTLANVIGFLAGGQFIDMREDNDIMARFGEAAYSFLTKSMEAAMSRAQQQAENDPEIVGNEPDAPEVEPETAAAPQTEPEVPNNEERPLDEIDDAATAYENAANKVKESLRTLGFGYHGGIESKGVGRAGNRRDMNEDISLIQKWNKKLLKEYQADDDWSDEKRDKYAKIIQVINHIEEKYKGSRILLMGRIWEISYSNLGMTLAVRLTGDVPSAMKSVELIIVHPDSDNFGWVTSGIGILLYGSGDHDLLNKIPLPMETINQIGEIYQDYTGRQPSPQMFSQARTNDPNDLSQFEYGYFQKCLQPKSLNEIARPNLGIDYGELDHDGANALDSEMDGWLNDFKVDDNSVTKEELLNTLQDTFGSEFNEFDAEAAIFWFAHDYHDGQWSDLYSILSTSQYKPARSTNDVTGEDETIQQMYQTLVDKYTMGESAEENLNESLNKMKAMINKL